MKVSIIIKALNEEHNIVRAIESSLSALKEANCSGEVVLADSLSTDQTVQLARNYPVKIVQLINKSDRSCGVGAELGFRVAQGEYLYILDADMEFQEGFLEKAIQFLDANGDYAGVAGMIEEMNGVGIEYQQRYLRVHSGLNAGEMNGLNMGGLFRRSSLLSLGYFTNRNLNSYEETELGARLKVEGWRLKRLSILGIRHYGHRDPPYQLLIKRIKSGYIMGLGELFRSAVGKKHFRFLIKSIPQLKLYFLYLIWLCCILVLFLAFVFELVSFFVVMFIFLIPLVGMSLKKRSLKLGTYSVISSIFNSLGMVVGFLKFKAHSPSDVIKFKVLD